MKNQEFEQRIEKYLKRQFGICTDPKKLDQKI